MKFRKTQNNTTWEIYHIIVNHNISTMGKLKIPVYLKRSYSKLISFYPFTQTQETTYFNLPLNKRIPFLFRYLIKTGRNNGLNKSLIDKLIIYKNEYDKKIKSVYSKTEYKDRMLKYMISKKYDSILNLYLKNDNISASFEQLAKYTKILINHIIDNKIIDIRKNTKKWKQENNNNNIPRVGQPDLAEEVAVPGLGRVTRGRRPPMKSYFDLNVHMGNISHEVSEWDTFIENEVNIRLEKRIQNQNQDQKKKQHYKESIGKEYYGVTTSANKRSFEEMSGALRPYRNEPSP